MRAATCTYQCSCQHAKSVCCLTKSEKKIKYFLSKGGHIWIELTLLPDNKLLKDLISSITIFTSPCPFLQWFFNYHLFVLEGRKHCLITQPLCCVPFTPKNSLQVKFSQILNEWTQTADHRALQGGHTWQGAAAWGGGGHGNTNIEFSQTEAHGRYSKTQWGSKTLVLLTMEK